MTPRITDVKYLQDYKIFIRFSDGTEGEINLKSELSGDVFEPLKDISVFKKMSIHPELHTIVWPNGADFAPEFLYDLVRITA